MGRFIMPDPIGLLGGIVSICAESGVMGGSFRINDLVSRHEYYRI
ncbi:hypothetical protein AB6F96_01090 [Proteus mirabilis]